MEITKSNKIIINDIMYSLSIAITSFRGDDGITARLPRKRGYTLVCERAWECKMSDVSCIVLN
ncbi:MAG: hypothetical protein UHM23_03245 [Clostridia bacterium]|nr:hypothetical protein [Clostridia bacterium]